MTSDQMAKLALFSHQLGHVGQNKLFLQLGQQYFCPDLRAIVKSIVTSCDSCQRVKQLAHTKLADITMQRLPVPFSTLAIDLKGSFKISGLGYSYILVIKELWSKFLVLVSLTSTTSDAIAEAIYTEYILRYGHFTQLQSDNAPNLTKASMDEICKLLQIKTRATRPYTGWNNGAIESSMRILNETLRKYCCENTDWPTALPKIALAFNIAPNMTSAFSSFQLVFGRECCSHLSFISSENIEGTDTHFYSQGVRKVMTDRKVCREILKTLHDKYCEKVEKARNKDKSLQNLDVGLPVYVKLFKPETENSQKMQPRWSQKLFVHSIESPTAIRVTTEIGKPPLKTVFHRDFVKLRVAKILDIKDTPILKPEQLEKAHWVTLDLVHNSQKHAVVDSDGAQNSPDLSQNDRTRVELRQERRD